jgi:hypothetical protein
VKARLAVVSTDSGMKGERKKLILLVQGISGKTGVFNIPKFKRLFLEFPSNPVACSQ